MPCADKVEFVETLSEKLKGVQSVVLADFKGLTVEEISGLRGDLRKESVEFKVIKNRLGKLALAKAECDSMDDVLKGNTAWAFGIEDPVAPARVLVEFAKKNDNLVIKGGLLESSRLDAAGVKSLSAMPNRKELLGMMARDLKAPATQIATVMQASLTKVAQAFSALGGKLEESEA